MHHEATPSQPPRTSPLQLAQCAAPADANVGARPQPRRHRRRDSLLSRHRSTGPELRLYPLHLFRLLGMLSCLWETLFLLPRWMACLLTVGDFPFHGDRSAEPRSSVACKSVIDFSGAAMFVASRGMGSLCSCEVTSPECQTCLSATRGLGNLSLYSRSRRRRRRTFNFQPCCPPCCPP